MGVREMGQGCGRWGVGGRGAGAAATPTATAAAATPLTLNTPSHSPPLTSTQTDPIHKDSRWCLHKSWSLNRKRKMKREKKLSGAKFLLDFLASPRASCKGKISAGKGAGEASNNNLPTRPHQVMAPLGDVRSKQNGGSLHVTTERNQTTVFSFFL